MRNHNDKSPFKVPYHGYFAFKNSPYRRTGISFYFKPITFRSDAFNFVNAHFVGNYAVRNGPGQMPFVLEEII